MSSPMVSAIDAFSVAQKNSRAAERPRISVL